MGSTGLGHNPCERCCGCCSWSIHAVFGPVVVQRVRDGRDSLQRMCATVTGLYSFYDHERMKAIYEMETKLLRIRCEMGDLREYMEKIHTDVRDLHMVATSAIEQPNNVCEVLVDIEDSMKTLAPKLERLVQVVRHRIDNQNYVTQCMYYSLDEQFLLLCDLANIKEEVIDPTCPYPFTLRLAHMPRGQGPRPRNRSYY